MKNNSKTKILYLHAGAELYGADKVLLELVSNLNNHKFKPIVVLPTNGILVKKLKERNIETIILDYPILRRNIFNFKGLLNYIKRYFKYSRKLKNIIHERDIDLLHVNTTAVLEGVYLTIKTKLPLVWHIHEIIVSPRIVYLVTSFLIGKFSTKVVTVSSAVKDHLVKSNLVSSKKITVVYNGVSGDVFEKTNVSSSFKEKIGIESGDFVVGMVGRINSWKGQKDFLKIIEPLLNRHPKVKALMVGGVFEGEEWRLDEIRGIISKSKNANRIILVDFQTNISEYYQLMDIFVLPSTNPDPLPTVVLEAMASSKAVVGYSHGGITEMISNPDLFLAEPRSTSDLEKIIENLIINKEMRLKEALNNKNKQLSTFNKELYALNFENVYEQTLKR